MRPGYKRSRVDFDCTTTPRVTKGHPMSSVGNLQVSEVPIDDLSTYHRNPRRGNVKAITESLRARGQYKPIVVNRGTKTGRDMEILAGNHTYAAAVALKWPTIAVVLLDVDDEEAAQIVAADNRIADLGTYDDTDLLAVLEAAGDLTGTGYSGEDLAKLQRDLGERVSLTDEDDVPDVGEDRISRPGDVWHLGPHVLYVGSCGDTDEVAAIAPGVVDGIWTDPPYGVNYVGGTGMTIQNDGADEALVVFEMAIRTALRVAKPGAPMYVAHATSISEDFSLLLRQGGVLLRQTLIWVKDTLVMGHSDYHWRHEPIFEAQVPPAGFEPDDVDGDGPVTHDLVAYGFTPGGQGRLGRGGPNWHGDNKTSTVFAVPRPKASKQHPTMKPVELIVMMLRNSIPPGGLVFDPFGGSGSTLIAAHSLGLRSLLCELDPKYADVICKRYEEHTGIVPIRDGQAVSHVETVAA